MTAFLVVSIVALWVLVLFQGFVLLETVRQIAQIRKGLDLDDRPTAVSMGRLAGRPVPEPANALWPGNGVPRDGAFVLLSVDCSTCRIVAAELRDVVARHAQLNTVVVLQARNHDEVTEMLSAVGLSRDDVVVDLEGEYAAAFGITTRPAAVLIRDGIVSEGATVRNASQLQQLLDTLTAPTREEVLG